MRRWWVDGWSPLAMVGAVLAVTTVLGLAIFAGEITEAVKKWRRG